MTQETISALVGGVLLGVAYAATGYLMSRRALGSSDRFMVWVVGGTMVRMALALAGVAIIIVAVQVHAPVFLGSFFLIFFASLAVEIIVLHRRHS